MSNDQFLIKSCPKLHKALTDKTVYCVGVIRGIPVDGEKVFNLPGISCGFVHLMNPITKKCAGFCGINYFELNGYKDGQ